jgi:uncharacterized protein (DUF983 family)
MTTPETKPSRPGFAAVLLRVLWLRCPRCGKGRLYRRWFSMYPKCNACELDFNREPGFYLGSIYVNYGLTAVMTMVLYYFGFTRGVPPNQLLILLMVFCLLFPIVLFRHARAVWLAFDQHWDPQERTDTLHEES